MSRSKRITLTIALFAFGITCLAHADEETLGRQAEDDGKLRTALNHYVEAVKSLPEGSSKDLELREKIIKLALKIIPQPAIPLESKRFIARGQAAIEEAKTESDFNDAVKEFKKASNAAPWWADAYFNLGVAQEKAGQYSQAINSLKLYLWAAPNAADTEAVQTKIFKLEYKMEKASRPAKTLRSKREREKKLSGTWRIYALKQSRHYRRPSMEKLGWYLLSNGSAKISATENEFEAVYTDHSNNKDWNVFRGKIEGKSIYGKVSEFYCNSAPRKFEGKISQDNKTILLIIRGCIFLPNCKYDAGSYGNSMLLER